MKEINVDWSRKPQSKEEARWISSVFIQYKSFLRYPSTQFIIPIILSVVDGYLSRCRILVDGLPSHISNTTLKDRDCVVTALSDAGFIHVEEHEGTAITVSPAKRLTDTLGKRKSELLDRSLPLGLHTWSEHTAVIELTDTIYADHELAPERPGHAPPLS